MHVNICRHGQAETTSVTGRDFDRPLTREGRLQARYIAGVLSQAAPSQRPRKLIASPAVRTMQTAQTIADELGMAILSLEELLPACAASVALAAIESHGQGGPVLMVGHNPTVTALVSTLLQGRSAGVCMPGPALRTGQMATIEIGPSCVPGSGRLVELHRYEPALV